MSADKLLVIIAGVFGVIFTVWFFLLKKGKEVKVSDKSDTVDIKVSGGYSPETVVVPLGKTTKLNFLRTDSSDCLAEVVLGDFKIKKELPLNKVVTIEIKPEKEGEYAYSCGMGMYHGKIVVK